MSVLVIYANGAAETIKDGQAWDVDPDGFLKVYGASNDLLATFARNQWLLAKTVDSK